MSARIEVDSEICYGTGSCATLAPEIFGINEDGVVELLDPSAGDGEEVRQAIRECPSGAIRLVDEDGEQID